MIRLKYLPIAIFGGVLGITGARVAVAQTEPPHAPQVQTPQGQPLQQAVPDQPAPALPPVRTAPANARLVQPPPTRTPRPPRAVVRAAPRLHTPAADKPAMAKRFLNYKGDFWVRYELGSGYWEKGLRNNRQQRDGDVVAYRARLALQTDPIDIGGAKGSATLAPQTAGFLGTGNAPFTVADTLDVRFYEAYFTLQTDVYQLDVGRFMMDYGDAALIGAANWGENGRAFQGLRSRFTLGDQAWLDGFVTLIQEGTPAASDQRAGNGDQYLYGLYADIGSLLTQGMHLDLYALGQTWGAQSSTDEAGATSRTEAATQVTLGARVQQKLGIFDYRVEGGFQTGSKPGEEAVSLSAFNVDAGIGVSPIKGLRLGLGGLIASGDDPETDTNEAWDPLYPTGHKFLGLSDVAGIRSNIQSLNLQIKYALSPSLIFKLDGHTFSRREVTQDAPRAMGSELDLQAIKKLGGKDMLRALYAVFLADAEFWPTDDPVHYVELQYGLTL